MSKYERLLMSLEVAHERLPAIDLIYTPLSSYNVLKELGELPEALAPALG